MKQDGALSLVNPADSLERQNEKLLRIADALMQRVEYGAEQSSAAYAQFERAALLEKHVRERTLELERTLDLLHASNAQLAQANQETESARRDLANAIETLSEGFALFDARDVLIMCNSRFCRAFPDTAQELAPGLPFAGYVERVSRSEHLALPEGQGPGEWAARRLKRHAEKHVMFNVRISHDRWLQVSEHRTSDGGTVVVQTDVTDLIRLERAEREKLKDTQARMIRATLDHLNQGVGIFDENRQLVGWNDKMGALLSLPARRFVLGARFAGLINLLDEETIFTRGATRDELLDWARNQGVRRPLKFEILRRGSRVLQIFCAGMPDRGFVISVTDVTAEREAERKLYEMNEILEQRVRERTLELEDALSAAERANASKSRFVAAASHDLLQPLSAAKLYVTSLSDNMDKGMQSSVLEKAGSALDSVGQIIDALLDISKLDGDGLQLSIRTVALNDILKPLVGEMEVLAAQKGLSLKLVETSAIVKTDPAYLRRIVQNLLANAIRYTHQGKVLVGARQDGDGVRIEIWDTGIGIAAEDQTAIFEEFQRLDLNASRNEGLGLGLAIVERACARLGHPLTLCSELGRGSAFKVTVPKAGARIAGRAGLTSVPKGLIVLLVENDPHMRRAISIMLESWRANVIEAENAPEALSLMADLEITPDALMLDYQLGSGTTGIGLFQALSDQLGTVPCAIISATRDLDLRARCDVLGLEFLAKPLDRHQLEAFLVSAAETTPVDG
ncbi:MAG: PAS-domain containing protein [Pelagimonas sp.]|jgi:signal transduction histidine kinase|nr:PAS-domain containing protein [Pelagimonas sp.]